MRSPSINQKSIVFHGSTKISSFEIKSNISAETTEIIRSSSLIESIFEKAMSQQTVDK